MICMSAAKIVPLCRSPRRCTTCLPRRQEGRSGREEVGRDLAAYKSKYPEVTLICQCSTVSKQLHAEPADERLIIVHVQSPALRCGLAGPCYAVLLCVSDSLR